MCFYSPIKNHPNKTHKQHFSTHPVPGKSLKFVYVNVFFLSLILVFKTASWPWNGFRGMAGRTEGDFCFKGGS